MLQPLAEPVGDLVAVAGHAGHDDALAEQQRDERRAPADLAERAAHELEGLGVGALLRPEHRQVGRRPGADARAVGLGQDLVEHALGLFCVAAAAQQRGELDGGAGAAVGPPVRVDERGAQHVGGAVRIAVERQGHRQPEGAHAVGVGAQRRGQRDRGQLGEDGPDPLRRPVPAGQVGQRLDQAHRIPGAVGRGDGQRGALEPVGLPGDELRQPQPQVHLEPGRRGQGERVAQPPPRGRGLAQERHARGERQEPGRAHVDGAVGLRGGREAGVGGRRQADARREQLQHRRVLLGGDLAVEPGEQARRPRRGRRDAARRRRRDRREHAEAAALRRRLGHDQRRLDERGHDVVGVVAEQGLGGAEPHGPRHRGQRREVRPERFGELREGAGERPLQGRAQRPAAVELAEHGLRADGAHVRGQDLDGERQPVGVLAQAAERGGVHVRCAAERQASAQERVGTVERPQRDDPLVGQLERRAARDEQLQGGVCGAERGDPVRGVGDGVEPVEHEERGDLQRRLGGRAGAERGDVEPLDLVA
ncbi:MAG: hypothetical protein R3F59_38425 [Myxococcota bacterium]